MSKAYTSDGKRRSSMTHARKGHECGICGQVAFGNGGQVSHGRSHVKRGEAVELVKHYATLASPSRFFFAPDDERVERFKADGYAEEA